MVSGDAFFIQSYLTNRQQIVKYADKRSMVRGVIIVLQQDSILELLIFILYVKDFSDHIMNVWTIHNHNLKKK